MLCWSGLRIGVVRLDMRLRCSLSAAVVVPACGGERTRKCARDLSGRSLANQQRCLWRLKAIAGPGCLSDAFLLSVMPVCSCGLRRSHPSSKLQAPEQSIHIAGAPFPDRHHKTPSPPPCQPRQSTLPPCPGFAELVMHRNIVMT